MTSARPPLQNTPSAQSSHNGQSVHNNHGRHRTVTPSPLSQSTSVVHLQPPDAGGSLADGRKLSKRRRRVSDLFGTKPSPNLGTGEGPHRHSTIHHPAASLLSF